MTCDRPWSAAARTLLLTAGTISLFCVGGAAHAQSDVAHIKRNVVKIVTTGIRDLGGKRTQVTYVGSGFIVHSAMESDSAADLAHRSDRPRSMLFVARILGRRGTRQTANVVGKVPCALPDRPACYINKV